MSKKSKVTKVGAFKEFDGKNGKIYYCDIELENGDKGNIGVKDQSKMTVGKELEYDITIDEQGRSKIKAIANFAAKAMGAYSDKTGMMVGNALANASLLAAHGVIKLDDIESCARLICQVSIKLKEEFKGQ